MLDSCHFCKITALMQRRGLSTPVILGVMFSGASASGRLFYDKKVPGVEVNEMNLHEQISLKQGKLGYLMETDLPGCVCVAHRPVPGDQYLAPGAWSQDQKKNRMAPPCMSNTCKVDYQNRV